jgi:hypothetical protein
MRNNFFISVLLVSVAAASGCGGAATERVPVAGKVLIDGQPLAAGNIRFVPAEGRPASGRIQSDGTYRLTSESINGSTQSGLPRGDYLVQVSSSKVVDDETIQWNAPQKYADFRTSGLKVTVSEPTDSLDIQLTAQTTDDSSPGNKSAADSNSNRIGAPVRNTNSSTDAATHSGEGQKP